MSEHDPLCPILDPVHERGARYCECALISQVRRTIVAGLAALPVHVDGEDGNPWIHRDHAIDLVKGKA